MERMREFLEMGGYAGFVWPCYLAVATLLGALLYLSLRGLRRAEADLAEVEGPEAAKADGTPKA